MKFTVLSSKLFSELQVVSRALPSKNTVRILETILLDKRGDKLDITASNGDLLIKTNIQLDSGEGEDGRVCVSPNILLDTLKELGSQPVTFTIDPSSYKVEIVTQSGRYSCVGFDGGEYPEIGLIREGEVGYSEVKAYTIPSYVLARSISATLPCTKNDDWMDVVSCLYFDFGVDKYTLVGTDTHRMAKYTCFTVSSSVAGTFLLSRKVAKIIQGLITDGSGDVSIRCQDQRVEFDFANRHISSSLSTTEYPDYTTISTDGDKVMIIDRQLLLNACKRVSVFSDQSTSLLKLSLLGDNVLHLSSQDVNYATSAMEELPCSYTDAALDLGLKASSIIEMLDSLSTSEITFKFMDAVKVVQMVPSENDEGCELILLLMPIPLQSEAN